MSAGSEIRGKSRFDLSSVHKSRHSLERLVLVADKRIIVHRFNMRRVAGEIHVLTARLVADETLNIPRNNDREV